MWEDCREWKKKEVWQEGERERWMKEIEREGGGNGKCEKMWKMQEEAEIDCRCVCACVHACMRVQSGYE